MECNKEEAVRAWEIAEKRLYIKDYEGAKKMALKAEKLFPQLDNISQLLTVCEVHCSAQLKVNGLHDWYKILQVESMSDENQIRRQYRKLALLLHPDKNKLPGAEAAFKLVAEANTVLSDRSKRAFYDIKRQQVVRPAGPHQHAKTKTAGNFNNANQSRPQPQPPPQSYATFWVGCPNCRTQHQFSYSAFSKTVRCVTCLTNFMAKPSPYPYPGHMSGDMNKQQFPGQAQTQTSGVEGTARHSTGGVRKPVNNPNPKPSTSGGLNTVTGQRRSKRVSANTSESNADAKPNQNPNHSRMPNANSDANVRHDDGGQTDGSNSSTPLRRSSRFKRDMNSDGTGTNISSSAKKARVQVQSKEDGSAAAASMNANASNNEKGKENEKEKVEPSGLNIGADAASPSVNAGTCPKSCTETNMSAAALSDNSKATFVYPDPEFCDFDKLKDERKFAVNQIWALYDNLDGMPRFYGRIRDISTKSGFKVKYTWLEHKPVNEAEAAWSNKKLPVGCGNFTLGDTQTTEDRFIFSHIVMSEDKKIGGAYVILPRKGEVWAVFKDWDIKWSQRTEKNRKFEYDIVEVLSDFSCASGISIVPLVKIQGFVSLFVRMPDWVPISVPNGEMLKFSHSIPTCRLSGSERDDIPEGSLELDTVALPTNFATAFTSVPMDVIKPRSPYKERNDRQELPKPGGPPNYTRISNLNEHTTAQGCESSQLHIDACYQYPDTEFYNFDVCRTCGQFQRGQIWALYADLDSYPKYYGYIKKVEYEPFKVNATWLDAIPRSDVEEKWLKANFPVSCGKFKVLSEVKTFESPDAFSHVVCATHLGKGFYEISPQVGEIWAVYKNWSANWTLDDFGRCEFDIVVITEKREESIVVWPLRQVTGYKAVFMRERIGNAGSGNREIPASEYIILSHRIPAFGLTEERGGKLRGFWELDPASVPDQFLYGEN